MRVILSQLAPEFGGGEPVTVRGLPGTYVAPPDRGATESQESAAAQVAVRLGDGRWLVLYATGRWTKDSGRPTNPH